MRMVGLIGREMARVDLSPVAVGTRTGRGAGPLEELDDARVRAHLLRENIEIGGGLGPLKGRIWRIGLMGSGSTRENVVLVLDALQRALNAEGFKCPSGVEAAEAVYKN